MQVQVNHLNVLLMGHLLGFPTSGKYRKEAMIDAVDAPLFEDAEPVKGWLEVMLVEETDQTLTGQLETIYDPEGLHEELVKRHPDLDPTRWEGLEMREVRTFHFDLESGWIDRVNEVITFSLPGIEGRSTTVTTLKLQ